MRMRAVLATPIGGLGVRVLDGAVVGVSFGEPESAEETPADPVLAAALAELTEYLRDHREAFDLIVSADTLVYFGDLESVLAAAAGALRANGLLVFTLEHAVGAEAALDYRLEFHGRYSHAGAHVERMLAFLGLQPQIAQAELRMESGAPVPGLVIRAMKS